MSARSIELYTDGASLDNHSKSKAAWCCVAIAYEGSRILNWAITAQLTQGTSNGAELAAVNYALSIANDVKERTTIFSDSKYVVEGITKRLEFWKVNKWRTGKGNLVANLDCWKSIEAQSNCRPNVTWQHVRAHTGIIGNELADFFCSLVLRTQQPHVLNGETTLPNLQDLMCKTNQQMLSRWNFTQMKSCGQKKTL